MTKDPVVEEIREAREAHAAKFGYDLDAIIADLRKKQEEGGRMVVSFEPKRKAQKSA